MQKLDSIYISYWSLRDPLCQSQSLPYLRGLAREGYRIGLITFEQPRWKMTMVQRQAKQEQLKSEGIYWHPLRYHKWPPVISTLYDIAVGGLFVTALAKLSKASFLHGRSSVPCAVGALASRLAGTKLFVDADGPLSQEYVDAGVWRKGSAGHRLTAWGERKSIESADVVAVLTKHRRSEVSAWLDDIPVFVLPCAVDLNQFRPLPNHRERLRRELGLTGIVFAYVGKAGGWYDTEGMVAFLAVAKKFLGDVMLLVLTPEDSSRFRALCERANIKLVTRAALPSEVPEYLSTADVGLSFRHRFPSQLSCSPIKLAEYLACGLPIISTSGCGDFDELIEAEDVGAIVEKDSPESYTKAALSIKRLLADPLTSERCRLVARRSLDLEEVVTRYSSIYRNLCDGGQLRQ